jgi:hypothetical protein
MGKQSTLVPVLEALRKYPNQDVTITQLTEETGLTRGQVQGAIANARARDNLDIVITTVVAGNVYRWSPRSPAAAFDAGNGRRLFEQIAVTKSGDLILQDDGGNLYRAAELT